MSPCPTISSQHSTGPQATACLSPALHARRRRRAFRHRADRGGTTGYKTPKLSVNDLEFPRSAYKVAEALSRCAYLLLENVLWPIDPPSVSIERIVS